MPQLFPNQAGALAMINLARNQVETVAEWSTPSSVCTFDRDQCWALWRGQVHVVNDPRTDLICAHVHAPIPASYVCVPLIARGDVLGVLHVSQSACEGSPETRQRLAQGDVLGVLHVSRSGCEGSLETRQRNFTRCASGDAPAGTSRRQQTLSLMVTMSGATTN